MHMPSGMNTSPQPNSAPSSPPRAANSHSASDARPCRQRDRRFIERRAPCPPAASSSTHLNRFFNPVAADGAHEAPVLWLFRISLTENPDHMIGKFPPLTPLGTDSFNVTEAGA